MKKTVFTSTILIIVVLFTSQGLWAKDSPYVLDISKTKDPDFEKVSLRNKSSGRILWTRTVKHRREAHWSADRRAVAVESDNYIFVWRAGQRLLTVGFPDELKLGHPQGYDYSMGYLWSPDNHRILVRFGASGSADMDAAPLYCLKLGRRHYRYLRAPTRNLVWKMAWQNNCTAVYWLFDYNKQTPLPKPYRWRVP